MEAKTKQRLQIRQKRMEEKNETKEQETKSTRKINNESDDVRREKGGRKNKGKKFNLRRHTNHVKLNTEKKEEKMADQTN